MKTPGFVVMLSLSILSFPTLALEKNISVPILSGSKIIKQKINLNTADVIKLTHSFKGIGKKRAQAIVSYRETNGQFKAVDELANVRGLGYSFVNQHLAQLQEVFSVN